MEIYVDGACSGNPGPGGFGVIVVDNNKIISAYRHKSTGVTTNNRMEMEAIIYVLENCGTDINSFSCPTVYSDSAYCVNAFTSWIKNWKANGWTRAKGKKLENLDLILKYDELCKTKQIDLQKVKGHDGVLFNELADKLAKGAITVEQVIKGFD